MTDATAGTAASLPRQRLAVWVHLLRQSFAAHWLIVGLPLFALIPIELILVTVDEPQRPGVLGLLTVMVMATLPIGLLAIGVRRLVQMIVHEKPPSPTLALLGELKSQLRSPICIVNAIPAAVGVLLSTKAMLDIKMNIPALNPFSWDEALMRLDRQLHGGVDPWLWLQPVLGSVPATVVIDIAYHIWLPVLFAVWVSAAFRPTFDEARHQFFVAFAIAMVFGGGLVAALISSAGPVYYALIGLSPDPFVPLLDFLKVTNATIPLWALEAHALLWDTYTGELEPYLGISAFPSMHNAMATLFALLAWRINRIAGMVFTIYAVLIVLGSVHLAWHYAVDSYAGVLIAVMSWWIAGRLTRWSMRLGHVRQYQRDLERLAA